MPNKGHETDFLKSMVETHQADHSIDEVLAWLKKQKDAVNVSINTIPFSSLKKWMFSASSLSHESGKFFSIDGIRIETNYGNKTIWEQPIINQPEIGYLGIIVKEINGVLHFLMQAKIEPGNINFVQLSPTLQATKSNYTKVHKGKAPPYLDYFRNAKNQDVLFDQLQSEQGARFLKKRNRNIIIKTEDDIELQDNFIWLTLGQIKALMQFPNIVNMDARTVISGILFPSFSKQEINQLLSGLKPSKKNLFTCDVLKSLIKYDSYSFHTLNELILFITRHKCNFELDVKQIPLNTVKEWEIGETAIRHIDNKYFEIIATQIAIENREVVNWTQPMIKPVEKGISAFVCKRINGVIHFAVQAKLECGNFDIIELAPTVQCLTGTYDNHSSRKRLPFLDYVLNAPTSQIIYDTLQSEEGGRFFKEQNRNMIILDEGDIPLALPEYYIWMTFQQLQSFMQFNNYINIQARNLLAAIAFD